MKKIINNGSSFEDFLHEEEIFNEVDEAAIKRVLTWQIEQRMKARHLKKAELARRMETSRSQVDRLLDPENTSVSLHTMYKAAGVLGMRLRIELEEPALAEAC